MRSRILTALASTEAEADHHVNLLARAQFELRALVGEALVKGAGWALFVTEASQVDVEGAEPELVAKHARLAPTDPWVELLKVKQIINIIGTENQCELDEETRRMIQRGTRDPPPPGSVLIIMAAGTILHAFCAKIDPLSTATKGIPS
jgi:hypothetical protein